MPYFDGCYFDPLYFNASPCGPGGGGGGPKRRPIPIIALPIEEEPDEAFLVALTL